MRCLLNPDVHCDRQIASRLTIPSSFKQEIEDKKGIDARHKSLFDFYKENPNRRMDTELGLYYLSCLHEACSEEQIRFESQVSQIPRNDLTVMTLSLQF
jgi:hypothetical protein